MNFFDTFIKQEDESEIAILAPFLKFEVRKVKSGKFVLLVNDKLMPEKHEFDDVRTAKRTAGFIFMKNLEEMNRYHLGKD